MASESALPRTLIVGDIHGCADELDDLLAHAGFDPNGDRLVLVGDLVAKGPDSKGVVDRARELSALCVRGNHEAHVLRFESARREGRPLPKIADTHREVLDALTPSDLDFLFQMPLHLHFPEHGVRVVHAGFDPARPVEAQEPDVMVNVRSIKADGTPSKKFEDGRLWATLWQGPETVIFGHDAMRKLQIHPFAVGLDTGCVYGGDLTAIELPTRRRFAVRARRVYAPVGD